MSAQILSLAQVTHGGAKGTVADNLAAVDAAAGPEVEHWQDGEAHRLAPSRGVAMGILVSLPVWLIVGTILYLAL